MSSFEVDSLGLGSLQPDGLDLNLIMIVYIKHNLRPLHDHAPAATRPLG